MALDTHNALGYISFVRRICQFFRLFHPVGELLSLTELSSGKRMRKQTFTELKLEIYKAALNSLPKLFKAAAG